MNIAIMANDKKKEQLLSFCTRYAGFFATHNLYATGTTGKILKDIGLNVHCFMAGRQGGEDQIAARIAYDEIDFLLFFRDGFLVEHTKEKETQDTLLRLCDIHNVIYATNVITAQTIIDALIANK